MGIKIKCVVGVIILDNQNKVLLQRRGDDNNWCIPGGGMDLGETVEETAKREVFEETGLIIDDMTLFNVYSGKTQHHIYPDGNEFYFVNVVFLTRKYHGHMVIDGDETKELKYFELNNLPSRLSATNIPIFQDLSRRINKYD
ncbi:NUDIX hydrolase [Paenibacillus sp. M1]|uniref:NUDIX hydrolase n=1 Tax=Paenibacillus haidiansis TaxID=1574488 RepID=A0ABU7VQ45_9BACL